MEPASFLLWGTFILLLSYLGADNNSAWLGVNRSKVRLVNQERTRFLHGNGFFYGEQFMALELE